MGRIRTFAQGLEALEGDFELVLVGELGRVVDDIDAEKRNDGHDGFCLGKKNEGGRGG